MSNLLHGWEHILNIMNHFLLKSENPTGNTIVTGKYIVFILPLFIHPKRHDVTKMASSLSQIRLGNYENVTHTKTPLIYTTRLQNGAKSHIHLLPSIFIEFFHCSYQLICNNSIKTQMNQGDFPVFFVRMTSQIGSLMSWYHVTQKWRVASESGMGAVQHLTNTYYS